MFIPGLDSDQMPYRLTYSNRRTDQISREAIRATGTLPPARCKPLAPKNGLVGYFHWPGFAVSELWN